MMHPSGASLLQELKQSFRRRFSENWAAALIVFLAALERSFSVIVQGPSGSGKTYLVHSVVELLPNDDVVVASRMSSAALLRLRNTGVLVVDELVSDPAFNQIRRQLISRGRVNAVLAQGDGTQHLALEGPVSVIECSLDEDRHDFQDATRAVTVCLNDSAKQHRHNALAAVRAATLNGACEIEEWCRLADTVQACIAKLDRTRPIMLDLDEERIVPPLANAGIARRVRQVVAVACAISRIRNGTRGSGPIRCGENDVREALELLARSSAVDDHKALPDKTRGLAHAIAGIVGITTPGGNVDEAQSGATFTIKGLLQELNMPHFRELAREVIHTDKRHGAQPRQLFTRRIIERHIKGLEGIGLVVTEPHGKEVRRRFTELGMLFLKSGSLNSYIAIQARLDATSDVTSE